MFWLTSVAPSFRASNGLVAWSVPTEHRSASSRTGRFTTFLAITWSSANSVGLRTSTIQSHCSTSMESTASIPLNSTRRLGREDIDRMPTMHRQAVLMTYVCISAIRMPALALCGTFVFRMRDGPGGLLQLCTTLVTQCQCTTERSKHHGAALRGAHRWCSRGDARSS